MLTFTSDPSKNSAIMTGRNDFSPPAYGPPGYLPSPANTMCYSGQDVAGAILTTSVAITTSSSCAALCVSTVGCSFSVFRAGGLAGYGPPLCQIKSSAFTGGAQSGYLTRRY